MTLDVNGYQKWCDRLAETEVITADDIWQAAYKAGQASRDDNYVLVPIEPTSDHHSVNQQREFSKDEAPIEYINDERVMWAIGADFGYEEGYAAGQASRDVNQISIELFSANQRIAELEAKLAACQKQEPIVYVDAGHLREVTNGNDMLIFATSEKGDRLEPLYLAAAPKEETK